MARIRRVSLYGRTISIESRAGYARTSCAEPASGWELRPCGWKPVPPISWQLRAVGASMKVVDLSHPFSDGFGSYLDLPPPVIKPYISRAESSIQNSGLASFRIDMISFVGSTGTYLDTPYHRFADGADLSTIDLERHVNVPGVLVSVPTANRAITPNMLPEKLPQRSCFLFATGWDLYWGSQAYMKDAPFLHPETAQVLLDSNAVIVGIDAPNIDDIDDLARPVHTMLLQHGIGIVEHLSNLHSIGTQRFRFFAAPPAIQSVGSFPVRAFALLDNGQQDAQHRALI